jgi:Carboxypeptidase regulatory-like domain
MKYLLAATVWGIVAAIAWGQPQQQSPPVVPAPGELHIPPNTRVIEGTVTAANGSLAANASVLLKDTKTLQVRSYIVGKDGAYHFYGLSTDVNYEIRAQAGNMTSSTKEINVFDSHKVRKIDLKLDKKKST